MRRAGWWRRSRRGWGCTGRRGRSWRRGGGGGGGGGLRQVGAGTPEAYRSQRGRGLVALERGDWAGAVKALTASLTRNPYQVVTSYTLPAKRLLEAKQYAEAKALLTLGGRGYPYAAGGGGAWGE